LEQQEVAGEAQNGFSFFFFTKTASVVVEAPNKTCLQPSPPIQLIQEKQNEVVLPNIF